MKHRKLFDHLIKILLDIFSVNSHQVSPNAPLLNSSLLSSDRTSNPRLNESNTNVLQETLCYVPSSLQHKRSNMNSPKR